MKNIRSIVFLFIAFGVGILLGYSVGFRNSSPEVAPIQDSFAPNVVSVMVDYGDGTLTTLPEISFQGSPTLFSLLSEKLKESHINFVYQEYKGLGKLVTQIGKKKNGEAGRYWQYWVNNRSAPVGADTYKVRAGDVIEWKFMPSQEQ